MTKLVTLMFDPETRVQVRIGDSVAFEYEPDDVEMAITEDAEEMDDDALLEVKDLLERIRNAPSNYRRDQIRKLAEQGLEVMARTFGFDDGS